ncbi:MAG: SdrD B-like domain-containing protein [Planctomycetota bacterium]
MGKKKSRSSVSKALKRSLRVEGLERRELMAADLVAFDGTDAQLYQIHGNTGDQGQLSIIDLSNDSYTDIGDNQGFKVNATGYRAEDNLIYGIKVNTRELVRIDANGTLENLGSVEGLPNSNHFSADFGGDGLLYIWSKTKLYGVNVDTQEVDREVTLSRKTGQTPDLAYDPITELMYGVEKNGSLRQFISVDHDTGTVTTINDNFTPKKGIYGAMFADATGRIFAANNNGGLYEVDKVTGDSTFVANTPRASSNDGNAPNTAVFNLPPAMQDALTNVVVGSTGNSLNVDMPFDPEGDAISISVSELPDGGVIRLSDGTAISVGDSLTTTELSTLTYDAPGTEDAVSDLVLELSDGNSTSVGRASILISGKARIEGVVDIIHGDDDGTFDGYAFNNVITLSGTNSDGDAVSKSTTSDVYGNYFFEDLDPGTYAISQAQPATVHDHESEAGSLGGTAGENVISNIVIPAGSSESYSGYDFSEYAPSSLTGFTYHDEDSDSALDSTDNGVPDAVIRLSGTDDRGIPISATTTTGAFGFYEFTGLRPGDYVVTQDQPDDFLSMASNAGTIGGGEAVNEINSLELDAGINGNHNDFGELKAASLAGSVYVDNDFDKAFDRGDSGIEGVTVTLTGTDMNGDSVSSTMQTDADGAYLFEDLLPGTYQIAETQPTTSGIIDSRENVGTYQGNPLPIVRNGVAGEDVFTTIEIRQDEHGEGYDFTETVQYILANEFGNTLVIEGTEGDDTFEFTAGETTHTIRFNGVEQTLDASVIHNVQFIGNGGNDVANLNGWEHVEQTTLRHHTGSLHSEWYYVQVFQTETINADYGGGFDRAFMWDTEGDDRFKATESYGRMWGDDYTNQADGFHRLYAYASTGEDRAYFHDSKKDDTFKASEDAARMFSRKYYNVAEDFDRVYAYANSGGEDTAILWDSTADNDILEANSSRLRMYNDHFYNQAEGFEVMKAHANAGGDNDRAYLEDTPGDDILVSSPDKAGMSGDGYNFVVDTFERMYATASTGNDIAYLYDSPLDDKFLGYDDHARLYNDDYFLRADNFDQVDAYSSFGGNDKAYFYDSVGDDTLVALENEVRMFGDGFDNTSHGFTRAYAWSENGGNDTAYLYDTDQADTLAVSGEMTRMYGDGYYTRLSGFSDVNSEFSDISNQDRAVVFGSIGSETLENAGADLSAVITDHGATYVRNADAVFGGSNTDTGDDDGDVGDTSDEFSFLPEKLG